MLIQDTAYQSFLRSIRQQYHQRTVQILAEQFPEIAEAQPELLVQHDTEASLSVQALRSWQQAGLARLRAGEIDTGQVFGDYLLQAKKVGLQIHETPKSTLYWVILSGQTTPGRPDYCPQCPWVGDGNDPRSLEKARKVRLALNLAVNEQAIIEGLWKGTDSATPFTYLFYSSNKGEN